MTINKRQRVTGNTSNTTSCVALTVFPLLLIVFFVSFRLLRFKSLTFYEQSKARTWTNKITTVFLVQCTRLGFWFLSLYNCQNFVESFYFHKYLFFICNEGMHRFDNGSHIQSTDENFFMVSFSCGLTFSVFYSLFHSLFHVRIYQTSILDWTVCFYANIFCRKHLWSDVVDSFYSPVSTPNWMHSRFCSSE